MKLDVSSNMAYVLIIGMVLLFAYLLDVDIFSSETTESIETEKVIITEVIEEALFKIGNDKVKVINFNGVSNIINIDTGYNIGDTIIVEL